MYLEFCLEGNVCKITKTLEIKPRKAVTQEDRHTCFPSDREHRRATQFIQVHATEEHKTIQPNRTTSTDKSKTVNAKGRMVVWGNSTI